MIRGRTYGRLCAACGMAAFLLTACDTIQGKVAVGTLGAALYGAQVPGHEIEQVYYLGAFDPQDQVPPMMYRIRVRGQASVINSTKFASGWVPAQFVDSLATRFGFNFEKKNKGTKKGRLVQIDTAEEKFLADLKTGRRLIQFGPEGFREVPKDHRLVIVMGASPDAFFEAIDKTLGNFAKAQKDAEAPGSAQARADIFKSLLQVQTHGKKLEGIEDTFKAHTTPAGAKK